MTAMVLIPEKRPNSVIVNNSETNDYPNPKRIKLAIMTSLECPVCLEVPRIGAGPILGCRNGHLICNNCVDKVKDCPTCREKEIRCRNLFAEIYIETEMMDIPLKCKNVGCDVHLPMAKKGMLISKILYFFHVYQIYFVSLEFYK